MSFATLSNIITMLFCIAVLVQSVRMMRCLRAVKGDEFAAMVAALDASTARARVVLADLREILRTDCAANARVIATGTAMREELTVMAGIGDAVAERIVEAVAKSASAQSKAVSAKPAPAKTAPAKTAPAKAGVSKAGVSKTEASKTEASKTGAAKLSRSKALTAKVQVTKVEPTQTAQLETEVPVQTNAPAQAVAETAA
ncbi:hypothetical protein [Sphingomonas echinoides]|uniref:hypothetical protein n=1 Tax=Sphingomonas echinoides TaxID=59803 RepID=UPI0024138738|nr:hypothetical protein [Sphingomonas echinoides]